MTTFKTTVTGDCHFTRVDDRFLVMIRRSVPPPMAFANLVISVFPLTDGEIWVEPYQVFTVDEGRIVELELQLQQKDRL